MLLFLKFVKTWTNNSTLHSWTTNTIRQKQHTRTSMTATCRYKWEVLPNNGMYIKKKREKKWYKIRSDIGSTVITFISQTWSVYKTLFTSIGYSLYTTKRATTTKLRRLHILSVYLSWYYKSPRSLAICCV